MTTTLIRTAVSAVSLAVALPATLVLGACAPAATPVTWDGAVATPAHPVAIRFDNQGQTHVDVYFVGEKREWWLGRVAPGALTTLRIPGAALSETSGFVRLAVLAGVERSAQAALDPRATFTIAQAPSSILTQRWTFVQTQLATPELLGAPLIARR
ncbi:MAG TPA: hypothetical protein VGH98_24745 [Gemmatimonadaceae bacterium]